MISVILIEPETAGNVGAIARVMKNFGFSNLILINPKCDHLSQTARNRAKNAQEVIVKAKVRTNRVLSNFDYLIATTAKIGTSYNIPRSPITPEQLSIRLSKLNLSETKIGLVIGRESSGLINEEIQKCDFTVSIPAAPSYSTLNISHAVSILLYEFHKNLNSNSSQVSNIAPISKIEIKQLNLMLNQIMGRLHFTRPERVQTQKKLWKKIFTRSFLSRRESFALMGIFQKIIKRLK
ncbi:RNA methyltransferase [Candidatus Woesearchaeota archaeon]|mgnify:CR=1 FL=1|jgi:tRNA/rRNA methyltransferase|nr:RNA methyltransferase [Candidatus Woesearchaeota archaeon]